MRPIVARFPWITAAVVAVAVVLLGVDDGEYWALRRGPEVAWRWWSGHLAHYSWNHLAWDAGAWTVLGAWLETRSRRGFLGVWLGGSAAIAVAFVVAMPGLGEYRGLSGVDAGLFAALTVELWRTRSGAARIPIALLALGQAAKVVWELQTGQLPFVDADGFVPVPIAHAVGAVVGASTWACVVRDRAGSSALHTSSTAGASTTRHPRGAHSRAPSAETSHAYLDDGPAPVLRRLFR